MKKAVLIFGGTTEGRKLAQYLTQYNISVTLCVTTNYAKNLIPLQDFITVKVGKMDKEEMIDFLKVSIFDLVIDATHPFAVNATKNIKEACLKINLSYIRLIRNTKENRNYKDYFVYVNSVTEAVNYLKNTSGNIFVTTGSKELSQFTALSNYQNRIFVRVLSIPSVIEKCNQIGLKGEHIISMQGPFSKELNIAMLRQVHASYLVTKESGDIGGFNEKLLACEKLSVIPIIITAPKQESGFSFFEVISYLKKYYNLKEKKKVFLIGIGTGNLNQLTQEAKSALEQTDTIIGANRITEALDVFKKPFFCSYNTSEIYHYIANSNYINYAVVFSGDTGFYSGAKSFLNRIKEKENIEAFVISGISSISYFCSKLKIGWEDAKLVSVHGKQMPVIHYIKQHKKTLFLVSNGKQINEILKELIMYQLGDLIVSIGENLSYPNEKITIQKVSSLVSNKFSDLAILLIQNPNTSTYLPVSISDSEFIRGKVPMTKEDIRLIGIKQLHLKYDSILYDIGAGTGSVSIEAAYKSPKLTVFAIEKNSEAVSLIIKNKKKFGTDNVVVIQGEAPNILKNLPAPTHCFIGGSNGNLEEILYYLLNKNPSISIIIHIITLETLSTAFHCIQKFHLTDFEIMQISLSKSAKLGNLHKMQNLNPVFILSIYKKEKKND